MVKTYSLILITFLCCVGMGFGQDLIISQYIETNSGTTPKGIEVMNVSGTNITFSGANNLEVYQGTNGAGCSSLVNIPSGTLGANQVWVIGTSDLVSYAIANGSDLSGTTDYTFTFNGDDALQVYLGGVLQDQFGICGSDPGSAWTGNGVSTANQNIQILDGTCDGDIDGWADPSTRFSTISTDPVNDMSGFGNAPTPCVISTDEVDWCSLQFPEVGSITLGGVFDVWGQVYEAGLTTGVGQASGITAEIGYSTSNTDPSTWTNWYSMGYNAACSTCDPYSTGTDQNDEYTLDLGAQIPSAGTYYYATRFSLNGGPYKYGGILADGSSGHLWDGITYISGVLTVTSTTCGSESFSNSNATSSYTDNSYVGDNGVTWNYVQSRDENGDTNSSGIDGSALMLRDSSSDSKITSSSVPGGIGDFSVKLYKGFTGAGNRQVELFVNGISQGTSTPFDDFDEHLFSVSGINISGNTVVEIRNITSKQVIIDDIEWSCYDCSSPIDTSSFTAIESCNSIDLSWIAPSCAEEVLVVAAENSAIAAGTPSGDGSTYNADADFSGAGTSLLSGKVVYKGNGTLENITGVTGGNTYYFKIFSRVGTSWSSGTSVSVSFSGTVNEVSSFTTYNNCGEISLNWTLPSCYDDVLIIAREGSAVTASPTGDGTLYTDNTAFGNGTPISAGQFDVYEGTDTSTTITGLTDGNTYYFEIFVRVGSSWSSGVAANASANVGTSSGPTTFNPGDLVFVGFDSFIVDGTDRFSILNMVDIGPGTQFTIANLLYEWNAPAGVSTGRWYDCYDDFNDTGEPPYVTLQYDGCADIPKGSIICIETNTFPAIISNITVNGIDANSDFNTIDNPAHANDYIPGNISTSNPDAMWLMQGTFSDVQTESDGPDSDTEADNYRLFDGTVLGALQTKGNFQLFSEAGDNGGYRVSRIHPDVECLYLETGPTSSSRFYGYHNGITTGTHYELLSDITNASSNWVIQSASSGQDGDDISSICGSSYTITGFGNVAGQWKGNVSTDWFDCHNWQNFAVPNENTNVIIDDNSVNNCDIDPSNSTLAVKYNNLAECNDLTLDSNINGFTLSMPDTTSILNLNGDWANNIGESFFDEGNGTVVFTGSSSDIQRVNYGGGPPTPPLFSTEEFYNVVLNNNFDTYESNDLYADGDLTVNADKTLTVASGDYVFVNNKVTVASTGTFHIEDSGSLIQSGNGTNTNVGKISMARTANGLQLLDYVYWSSPINEFYVNDIFSTTSNIYKWSPTLPNGNGGEGTWVSAAGSAMAVGEGYIARVPNTLIGSSITANFDVLDDAAGRPNNGDINVTITKGSNLGIGNNSGDLGAVSISIYDDNWNLVGNPYPSAISADDFISTNTTIDGFIYLWRHLNAPNIITNDPFYDDFEANYADSDYVAYNYMGTSTPIGFYGFVGAGQSFMVNMDETISSSSSSVVFNNSMRDIFNDNSQFYKTGSIEKHRIWVNLYNSNDVILNTILVGYASGATMERDRLYDAVTNAGNTKIYSLINDEKFIIQGRGLPFEVTDHIPLGLSVSNSGSYYIGIADVDGLFEDQNQTVYLKDNYLNLTFNISENPYSFFAESGEFNDRFEIVFQTTTLSTDDVILSPSDLTIIELPDGSVKFKVSKDASISQVEIIDVLGRRLYTLEGSSSEEVYFLPQLHQAAYVARVTLDSGQTLIKKAIKK